MRLVPSARILPLVALALATSWPARSRGDDVARVADLLDWTIVLDERATPAERHAAEELRDHLRLAADADGDGRSDSQRPEQVVATRAVPGRRSIFVGPEAALAGSMGEVRIDDLGEEGVRIVIGADAIAIVGGRPRGTLYAVYEFLERYAGVRFLTPDHTHVPPDAATRPLPPGEFSYVPPFSFRWSFYRINGEDPAFAARLRVNTVSDRPELGGRSNQRLINHTLFKQLPPEKWGAEHPEYFALVDGVRKLEGKGGGPEICSTNPDVAGLVAEAVLREIEAEPNLRNISVSQNDNSAYCRCPECAKVAEREGTQMGPHLEFANKVADLVGAKHPEVKIGTLAYWYTRVPPKTLRPRPNMQIQLCSIEACTLHALNDPTCEKNRAFASDTAVWGTLCDDIWIWNYNTNFGNYDLPFPNLRAIGPNLRFFRDNHAKGVFMQANGNGRAGEFGDLRNYVLARGLWDPELDSWALAEEFCKLHYVESSGPIIAWLMLLHGNAEARGVHPGCFPKPADVGLTPEVARAGYDLFKQAMSRAKSDVVRERVEKASITAYKAVVATTGVKRAVPGAGADAGAKGVERLHVDGYDEDVVARYVELARKHGMDRVSEERESEPYFKEMLGDTTGPR